MAQRKSFHDFLISFSLEADVKRVISRALAALMVLTQVLPASAYDAATSSRYPSPDMNRPNVNQLTIHGPGSKGPVDGMSVTPRGGTTSDTLSNLLGRTVYITNFMSVGSTDITDAIGKAAQSLGSSGGNILLPPSATGYTISHKVSMPGQVCLVGEGRKAGLITTSFDGDILAWGDGTTSVDGGCIRNVAFHSTITRTAGAAVALRGTYNFHATDVTCDQKPYVCIDVHGGPNAFKIQLDRILAIDSPYVGIRVGFEANGNRPGDIFINDPVISTATRANVEFLDATGIITQGGDFIGGKIGWLIDPGDNQYVGGMQTNAGFLDTSVNEGLKISPTGTGEVSDNTFSGLWAATNGQSTGAAGVLVQGTAASVRSVTFSALRVLNGGGEGVRIEGGAFIDFTGPQINFNGLTTLNTYSGMYIGAGVSHIGVAGGRIGAGSKFVQPTYHKYGVEIAAGAGDYISIAGTDLSGNQTGPISNGATGANQVIMPLGADAGISGGKLGVGTKAPFSPLSVAGASHAYSDAQFGLGTFQMSTGAGGQFDMSLMGGVNDGQYTWLQSGKPGTGNYPLYLNPNGGSVVLGRPAPSTSNAGDYLPYLPAMAGTPTATPNAISGTAPFVVDGTNGKLCAYVNSAWKCATLQ